MEMCTEASPSPTSRRVKCLICKEKIMYDRDEPELLVNHVRMSHPSIEIAGLTHTSSPESLYQTSSQDSGLHQAQNNMKFPKTQVLIGPSDSQETQLKEIRSSEFKVPYNRVKLGEENKLDNSAENDSNARCMVCNMRLRYDKSEPENLVQHVKLCHPYLKVAGMTAINPIATIKELTKKTKIGMNSRKFEKSVTAWQLENGVLSCKRCGTRGVPEKRTSKQRSNSSAISTCLKQWCWFFYFFMNQNDFIDLHCGSCKAYLGTYNCLTKTVKKLPSVSDNPTVMKKVYCSYSAPSVTMKSEYGNSATQINRMNK